MPLNLEQKIAQLRKAELHVHLEGSVNYQTLRELSQRNAVALDAPVVFANARELAVAPELAERFPELQSFQDFISTYLKISECIQSADDVVFVAERYLSECAPQNICHSEMYFSPSTFSALGRDLDNLFKGLQEAQRLAKSKYNSSLCWIFDIVRNTSVDGMEVLSMASRAKTLGVSVAAIGLAGLEKGHPAIPFAGAFNAAREQGFAVLAHAGESSGAKSVRESLDVINPQRIGHGLSILDDTQLTSELCQSQTPIEVCPWSNVILGNCAENSHPLRNMLRAGLNVIICSDDPGIFGKTLCDNYRYAASIGLGLEELASIAKSSLDHSLIPVT